MDLTLTALKFMIGLAGLSLVLELVVALNSPTPGSEVFVSFFNIVILVIFFYALKKPVVWMAYLFFAICIINLIAGIAGGLRFENIFSLINAILCFVAAAGIFHWLRDRKQATTQ